MTEINVILSIKLIANEKFLSVLKKVLNRCFLYWKLKTRNIRPQYNEQET